MKIFSCPLPSRVGSQLDSHTEGIAASVHEIHDGSVLGDNELMLYIIDSFFDGGCFGMGGQACVRWQCKGHVLREKYNVGSTKLPEILTVCE